MFATTRWTLVQAAGGGQSLAADEALEVLCSAYWYPLYAFVRRQGFSSEDAEDLTQGFFVMLLERRDLRGLEQEKGRFRAFLLAAMKHFLGHEREKRRSLKRGGKVDHLSLDWEEAESRFEVADRVQVPPDEMFDREWALALLTRALVSLREACAEAGKSERFEQLKVYLDSGKGEISYREASEATGMEETAVRVAVHRLRKEYRKHLREQIADTLNDPEMVEDELAVLMRAFEG
ncbi:RNA polymerase sigma factor [Haloferula sp.]|uniref:RNA polymerase sigma factor n=1 Tax=Haloferula sp. TaxID=2497595 RepID=UPI003C7355A3